MAKIKDEKQYKAIMARIDELFSETDENTSPDDPRLQELDRLSALVEEYEKEHSNSFVPIKIKEIWFENDQIYGRDTEGQVYCQSLVWYPRLRAASNLLKINIRSQFVTLYGQLPR